MSAAARKSGVLPCCICAAPVLCEGKNGLRWLRNGRAFCSPECTREFKRRVSSATMARTNRVHAGQRMRERNPMRRDESRERMATTLRAIGHRPKERGGNGRGPTEPQRLLAEALGWPIEVIVRTEQPRGSGYPPHYKIDVGNAELRVAVEVDGGSHCSRDRRAQDAKKDALLSELGWTVLRFTNIQVLRDLDGCVRAVREAACFR